MTLGVALALSFSLSVSAAATAKSATTKAAKTPPPTTESQAAATPQPAPAATPPPVEVTPPSAPADPNALRIGVVDFLAAPDQQGLAAALSGFVANELQRLGAFQVTTTDQIRQMLSIERQAQLLGCPDDSCRGQTVVSLGFDDIVTGKLTRLVGAKSTSTLTLELVLINQKSGQREASDVSQASTESDLMSKVSGSVVKLVGVLLKSRSGGLVLSASESGATVKVDDVIVGTTPVGQTTITGGPHIVAVEKDGFVTWQKEVRVKPESLVEEPVKLVPSPDFIAAWHGKQSKLRIGAWASAAVAVVGVALAVGFGLHAQSLYGDPNTKGSFQYERNQVLAGDETQRSTATSLQSQIQTAQTIAYLGIGAAAVGGVASAVFWILSDNPNKYDVYKTMDVRPQVGAFFGPGQGGFAVSGHF